MNFRTYNKVVIEGIVGSFPEYRTTSKNAEVAIFVIGTEDDFFYEIRKQWHTIVVIDRDLIGMVRQCITKGVRAKVEGILSVRKKEAPVYKQIVEIIVGSRGLIKIIDQDVEIKSSLYTD